MSFELNGQEYEIPTKQAILISNLLSKTWSALGKPTHVNSDAGKKLMTVIISAWEDTFPEEARVWQSQRSEELLNERTVRESIKSGGHNSAAYPYWLFQMMCWGFPQERWANKETVSFLIKNFPVFRTSNYT